MVAGMHCASCALTVERALKKVPGVKKAEVNFKFNKEKKKLFIKILIHYENKHTAPVSISEDVTRFKDLIMENQNMSVSMC